jgi:hypothetical protein
MSSFSKPTPFDPALQALIEQSRGAPPMTSADIKAQRISFAYGNASLSNPRVTREMVQAEDDRIHGVAADEAKAHAMAEALRAALPAMRRAAYWFFEGVAIRLDPFSITPPELDEAAAEARAIRLAEACVGRQPDFPEVDTEFLDAALARAAVRAAELEADPA